MIPPQVHPFGEEGFVGGAGVEVDAGGASGAGDVDDAGGAGGAGTQIPPQSAPPLSGSQPSPGLSTHVMPVGQGTPRMPPQNGALPTRSSSWLVSAVAAPDSSVLLPDSVEAPHATSEPTAPIKTKVRRFMT
jgi:hypothetical protein